jgi:hypothetical protein
LGHGSYRTTSARAATSDSATSTSDAPTSTTRIVASRPAATTAIDAGPAGTKRNRKWACASLRAPPYPACIMLPVCVPRRRSVTAAPPIGAPVSPSRTTPATATPRATVTSTVTRSSGRIATLLRIKTVPSASTSVSGRSPTHVS